MPKSSDTRPVNVWDIETEHENPELGPLTDIERRWLWFLRNTLSIHGQWETIDGRRRWVVTGFANLRVALDDSEHTPEKVIARWRDRGINRANLQDANRAVGRTKASWTRLTQHVLADVEAILKSPPRPLDAGEAAQALTDAVAGTFSPALTVEERVKLRDGIEAAAVRTGSTLDASPEGIDQARAYAVGLVQFTRIMFPEADADALRRGRIALLDTIGEPERMTRLVTQWETVRGWTLR